MEGEKTEVHVECMIVFFVYKGISSNSQLNRVSHCFQLMSPVESLHAVISTFLETNSTVQNHVNIPPSTLFWGGLSFCICQRSDRLAVGLKARLPAPSSSSSFHISYLEETR